MKQAARRSSVRCLAGCYRRGGALIEGALLMSLLIMLSFGAVEYGYAFYLKHAIQGAAYAGARSAITTGSTNATVQTAIAASLAPAGFQTGQFTVATSPASVAGLAAGTYVTVTVSCNWGTVGVSPLPVSMGGLPATKQLTCSVVMSHE
jgi:Flp pilus assembly protein TadG